MATNFPTSLDTLTNPTANDKLNTLSHSDQHANANDAIEALEAKVGADSSAVTSSHDYKLSNVSGSDKAVSLTGTETLTNKTITNPTVSTGVFTTPDINTPDIDGGSHDDGTFANPELTGTVEIDLGSDAEGDIYYRNASGEFTRLPKGSDGEILELVSGIPSWETFSPSGVTVEGTAGATHSLTTTSGQVVLVTAKGTINSATSNDVITLAYNGTSKDTVTVDQSTSGGKVPFFLTYFETPGAATQNVTVTSTASLTDLKITVTKL